ncbi:hypothetical protein Patl1_02062 [Pistacia atlantica]|uniref:Uncharacterized protein n=1 Tax=Pistacia atlantica TaxID=434234 RepID=A0ACC1CD02_9ROSI|nr:hypothetical protein Patl1_02062 [Pistacia atlantica]
MPIISVISPANSSETHLLLWSLILYLYFLLYHVCPIVIYAVFMGLLANLTKDRGRWTESIPSEKVSRWNVHPFQSNVGIEVEAVNNGNSNHGPLLDQGKLKRRKNISTSFPAADKLMTRSRPEVEKIEQVVEMASAGNDKRVIFNAKRMPFRLPPAAPIPRNAYLQYAGDDENVDVVG